MNSRTIEIIQYIASSDKDATLSSLADACGVSQRTIRNDLHEINSMLAQNGYQELQIRRGGRIEKPADFADGSLLFNQDDYYVYHLSKEERKKIAAALIVSTPSFITLADLADLLYVNRATVISDLDDIKAYIRRHGLQVDSHPNKGLRALGPESRKREFLLHIILPDLNSPRESILAKHISIQAGDRVVIQKIVHEQEHTHQCYLTDVSFQRLTMYLGIMVNRNLQGEYMEVRTVHENRYIRMAQDILKYTAQYCQIQTTEDEVGYLCEFLAKCRFMKTDSYSGDIVRVQMLTRRFIDRIAEDLGPGLTNDYVFFENLANHFYSVFSSEPAVYTDNQVVDQVLQENPEVLDAVNDQYGMLKDYAGRDLTEDEIKYICIHVCAAMERQKQKEVAFHVVLACNAGIGTSQLLLSRLKEHFNFHIVDIISAHEADKITEQDADFIISTVPLKNCHIDYVVVSPMLNDEDYIKVGSKIDALRTSRNLPSRIRAEDNSPKQLMKEISEILYRDVPEQAPHLQKKIRRTVYQFFREPEENSDFLAPALHHLLPPSHIQLDVACTDWKDAVRKSAQPLLEKGYIKAEYIDAMIANIEENGPYVVISPGFALPHEGVEKGSIKVGMNLIRLQTPVEFGEEEFDPVEFVCTLSAVDSRMHLRAFFNLVNLLQKPDFKKKLHAASSPEEAARIIEDSEYSL